MRLDVVIPTWHRPAELARCLDALALQSRIPETVLVVMRADDPETAALLDRPREDGLSLRPVRVERPGVVHALRAGFSACEADVVAITDDDSAPHRDWLERLGRGFEINPDAGAMGGRDHVHRDGTVVGGDEGEVGRIRAFGRVVGNHHAGSGPPRDVDVLKGVNMALRRTALDGVDFGNGLRGSGGAQVHWEMDLCLALKSHGWRVIYDPRIAVDHHPAQRFGDDQREERSLGALADEVFNHELVLLRRLPSWRAAVALAYGLVVGSRHAPGVVTALERAVRGQPAWSVWRTCERARLDALRAALCHT